MKKFIINILIFFGIVAAVDVVAGKVFGYLQSNIAGGRTGAEYYACRESNEDVIIMGSSRASHHYVPQIITDSLGLTCFNAGQDGNGIILQYGRWKMISERYVPKLIIYDIAMSFDMEPTDNMTYVDRLKPFCRDKAVADYVADLFPIERIKLLSQMYCYNYKFLEMASDCLKRGDYKSKAGYIPLNWHIRQEVVDRPMAEKTATIEADEVKLHYMEQLLKETKEAGTDMVIVVSPSWKGGTRLPEAYAPVRALAEKYGAPFYEYINSPMCDDPDYFEDSSHLNDKGARRFTEEIVSLIKRAYEDKG